MEHEQKTLTTNEKQNRLRIKKKTKENWGKRGKKAHSNIHRNRKDPTR